MSLEIDGVWKTGVWATTVWADGVWREGATTIAIGYLKGDVSVFSAYNGGIQITNALTGEVDVFIPLKIQ